MQGSVSEFAKHLLVSSAAIRHWITEEDMPAERNANTTRGDYVLLREKVAEWLESSNRLGG